MPPNGLRDPEHVELAPRPECLFRLFQLGTVPVPPAPYTRAKEGYPNLHMRRAVAFTYNIPASRNRPFMG
jgi:hypothetical protein